MKLGTLTITGDRNIDWDGLSLGTAHCTWRFKITSGGLLRKGTLYLTHDPAYLAEALGFFNYKYSLHYNKEIDTMKCPNCGQDTIAAKGRHAKQLPNAGSFHMSTEWYDKPHQGPKRYQQGEIVFWCCQTCSFTWEETNVTNSVA